MADILKVKGKGDLAQKHIAFIYTIKQTYKWRIPQELMEDIKSFQIDIANLTDLNNQKAELKRVWKYLKFEQQKQYKGKIKIILPNGNAGFIKCENGESFYFNVKEFKNRRDDFKEGTEVTFYLEDGFDKKKNRRVKNAIKVMVA